MDEVPVLVIAPDERWLRVLETTLKLGGFQPIVRRSLDDALHLRLGDPRPCVVIVDLGMDSEPGEVAVITSMLAEEGRLPAADISVIVILPDRLAREQQRYLDAGAQVLVRPYPPSQLYALLVPGPRPPSAGARGSRRRPRRVRAG